MLFLLEGRAGEAWETAYEVIHVLLLKLRILIPPGALVSVSFVC